MRRPIILPFLATFAVVLVLIACDSEENPAGSPKYTNPGANDTVLHTGISDLDVVDSAQTWVRLSWTSPGGGVCQPHYELRHSTTAIDEDNWAEASSVPVPAIGPQGMVQQAIVRNLHAGIEYFFAIKVVDTAGTQSEMSNVVSYTIIPATDTVPPARISDLHVVGTTGSSLTLSWTAPGDNGCEGRASFYQLRRATRPITELNWDSLEIVPNPPIPGEAGLKEHFLVTRMQHDVACFLALRTMDREWQWSGISNVVSHGASPADTTTDWIIDLGGAGAEDAVDVVATDDGGCLVLGSTTSSGAGGKDVYLSRIDSLGGIVWERTYGSSFDEYPVSLTESGGVFLFATNVDDPNPDQDFVRVIGVDQNGSMVRDIAYPGSGEGRAYGITALGTGEIMITAKVGDTICLVGFDPDDQAETYWWRLKPGPCNSSYGTYYGSIWIGDATSNASDQVALVWGMFKWEGHPGGMGEWYCEPYTSTALVVLNPSDWSIAGGCGAGGWPGNPDPIFADPLSLRGGGWLVRDRTWGVSEDLLVCAAPGGSDWRLSTPRGTETFDQAETGQIVLAGDDGNNVFLTVLSEDGAVEDTLNIPLDGSPQTSSLTVNSSNQPFLVGTIGTDTEGRNIFVLKLKELPPGVGTWVDWDW